MKSLLPQASTIDIEGVGPVLLERSQRARRLIISIKPFKGVRVAVPKRVTFRKAEQLARGKAAWLKTHLAEIQKYEKLCTEASAKQVTINREEAREVLVSRLRELARKFGYQFNRVTIRNQRTRWGSCSARNNISLNMKLALLPDVLRDFILLHELVHTKIKNHGKAFWAELLRVEPNARELDRRVNQYDLRLL